MILKDPPLRFFPSFCLFFRVPVLTNLHLVIAFCQNGSENVHFRSRITWNLPSESTLLDSAHFFQIWGFARNFNGNFLVFSIGFAGISQEFKGISRYFLSAWWVGSPSTSARLKFRKPSTRFLPKNLVANQVLTRF